MVIKWKRLHPLAQIPKTQSKGAACVDLVATEIIYQSDRIVTVELGFGSSIPKGYKAVIVPRSSFTHKGWVMQNSPAQIDSDYRGQWMLKFEAIPQYATDLSQGGVNLGYMNFPFSIGDRVAQCYIEKVILPEFIEVEELDSTERGSGGFGSTNLSEAQQLWKNKNMY